jgi:hypothetical protein
MVISLFAGVTGLLTVTPASATLSLEQHCIAAGLTTPIDWHGYVFNHHPEKDREVRATDNFLAAFEVASEFEALIADVPAECRGRFSRFGQIQLQFRSSRGGKAWHSIYRGWEEVHWGTRYLDPPKATVVDYTVTESTGEATTTPPEYGVEERSYGPTTREHSSPEAPLSPFVYLRSVQNTAALGLGCATAGRARIKLRITDDATKAIVAVRFLNISIPVDSWAQARCLGKFSIQDSGAAPRCGKQVVGGGPGGPPLLWGVKVQRVGCGPAMAIGQAALQVPAFSQGSLAAHRVAGWRCYFGFRGAVACLQGSKRIYLIARKGAGPKCASAPRGIKRLGVANTSCEVAAGLAVQIQQDPAKELLETVQLGGGTWSCPAIRRLDSDDLLIFSYHCFAGEAMVAFEVAASRERVVPPEPAAIPAEAILRGNGPAALFALTPEMKFGERAKWTRTKSFVPVEVEPALVGQMAHLELVESEAECTWTADQGQTSPICPKIRKVNVSRRKITLRPRQMLYLAPRKRRGNWLYRLTIEIAPFTYNGLDYRRSSHLLRASVINEADNCEINPWCHPNKKRAGADRGWPMGGAPQLR